MLVFSSLSVIVKKWLLLRGRICSTWRKSFSVLSPFRWETNTIQNEPLGIGIHSHCHHAVFIDRVVSFCKVVAVCFRCVLLSLITDLCCSYLVTLGGNHHMVDFQKAWLRFSCHLFQLACYKISLSVKTNLLTIIIEQSFEETWIMN